jgi:NitT/TauT family transport system permease protein
MTVFGYRIPLLVAPLVWAALWEVVGRSGLVFLLPPFSAVLAATGELVASRKFAEAALLTLYIFAVGMAISIAVGVPLGILMGRVRAANQLLGMWVNLFVSAPLTALVPVIMLLFGFGHTTMIVTVVLFAVWIIALDTYAGVRHVSPSLVDMARSFGANRAQLYGKVLIWAALPEILAGIRLGVIRGVKGMIIGQLLISIVGLGELFELYSRNFLMEQFWALTILVFAFALLASEAIGMIERRIEYYAGARS